MESIKQVSLVTLTNMPKMSDQKADEHSNERRMYLAKRIPQFVAIHDLFKNAKAEITFFTDGVSSLVCSIEVCGKKTVLKIPLSTTHAVGEPQFLAEWEKAGVHVPHVIETGSIDEHQYMLMEHIDTPKLNEVYSGKELLERGIYFNMGKTLKMMHEPVGKGYGRVIDGQGQYATFPEWINSPDIQKYVAYVNEHNLLGEEYGSFEEVRAILTEYVEAHPGSSYCHDDFDAGNIFATEPITVFDPNPRFNHGYIDIGSALRIQIAHGRSEDVLSQFKQGYFGDDVPNEKVLHASIILDYYKKLHYWNKLKEERIQQKMEKVERYLKEHVHLLK